MEATTLCRTVEGMTLDYDTLVIFTLIKEDGELKVLRVKDFAIGCGAEFSNISN